MGQFFTFWYAQSFRRFWEACQNTIASFEQSIAVRTTIKNIRRPLFQDYTWDGRVIGFCLRLGRILFGLLFYVLVAAVFLVAYLGWNILPAYFVVVIIGSIAGS